jgi:hypothetical protein
MTNIELVDQAGLIFWQVTKQELEFEDLGKFTF